MAAAERIVRDGGTIICAAECRTASRTTGRTARCSAVAVWPRRGCGESGPPNTVADQWQVQILGRIQSRARVVVCTAGLTGPPLGSAHMDLTAT